MKGHRVSFHDGRISDVTWLLLWKLQGKGDVKSLCSENSSGRSLAKDHRCVHVKVALLAWTSAMSRKRPCVSLP